MNVSLTPELDRYGHGKVATGRYGSASEVVREALRTMQERDEIKEALRQKIELGMVDLERGATRAGSIDEVFDGILAEAHKDAGL